MDEKTQALIGVGAAVVAKCQPCLKHYSKKAKKSGAEEKEILTAISIAKMVGKGSSDNMNKFISTLFEVSTETLNLGSESDCGCGLIANK